MTRPTPAQEATAAAVGGVPAPRGLEADLLAHGRLRDLIDELDPDPDCLADLEDTDLLVDRFVLVQRYRLPDRAWLTFHASREAAAEYHLSDEDPYWWPERLVNLESGTTWRPVLSLMFVQE